jgi:hypothetical protein
MLIDVSTRRFGRPVWLREVDVPANRCWGFEIGVRGGGSWRFRRRGCEFMATVLSRCYQTPSKTEAVAWQHLK